MFYPENWKKLKRGPQVILWKDAGTIISTVGLQSGDSVVDAGAGSGWLAIRLGLIVGEKGKVTSYEWREDFAGLAEKNVAKAGLGKIVEVKRKNVFEGIDEKDVDLITLDLADSEKVLPAAHAALKEKGFVVGYSPNVEQVRRFVEAGLAAGLEQFRVVETIEREWLVRPQGCRPATMGLMHTAFLSFLRKPARKE